MIIWDYFQIIRQKSLFRYLFVYIVDGWRIRRVNKCYQNGIVVMLRWAGKVSHNVFLLYAALSLSDTLRLSKMSHHYSNSVLLLGIKVAITILMAENLKSQRCMLMWMWWQRWCVHTHHHMYRIVFCCVARIFFMYYVTWNFAIANKIHKNPFFVAVVANGDLRLSIQLSDWVNKSNTITKNNNNNITKNKPSKLNKNKRNIFPVLSDEKHAQSNGNADAKENSTMGSTKNYNQENNDNNNNISSSGNRKQRRQGDA